MNPIQHTMARYAHMLQEQQKLRPLDDDELWLLQNTEPTLRRAEQREAELAARKPERRP